MVYYGIPVEDAKHKLGEITLLSILLVRPHLVQGLCKVRAIFATDYGTNGGARTIRSKPDFERVEMPFQRLKPLPNRPYWRKSSALWSPDFEQRAKVPVPGARTMPDKRRTVMAPSKGSIVF